MDIGMVAYESNINEIIGYHPYFSYKMRPHLMSNLSISPLPFLVGKYISSILGGLRV